MGKLELIKKKLNPGKVYRRSDILQWSSNLDHYLPKLVLDGSLEKLSRGLYYAPLNSVFGKIPADEQELLSSFLKDNRFVVLFFSDFNTLGVGTTQLYNERIVYNKKRHGIFKLGNRNFNFIRKAYVPQKITKEFLIVDLMNNFNKLEEDEQLLLANIKKSIKKLDRKKLNKLILEFGSATTKKQLSLLLN